MSSYKEYATKLPHSNTWWDRDGECDDDLDVLETYCSGDLRVAFAWSYRGKTGWYDATNDPLAIEISHAGNDCTPVWSISVSDMVSEIIEYDGGLSTDEDKKSRALAIAEALESQANRLRDACK